MVRPSGDAGECESLQLRGKRRLLPRPRRGRLDHDVRLQECASAATCPAGDRQHRTGRAVQRRGKLLVFGLAMQKSREKDLGVIES